MSRQEVTVFAIVGGVRRCGDQAFLTSEYQIDFAIVSTWRHPPMCRQQDTKTAALIFSKPPFFTMIDTPNTPAKTTVFLLSR